MNKNLGHSSSMHAVVQNGETLQRNEDEQKRDQRLRFYSEEISSHFKHHWNQNSLLFLKRQSLSRILYLDNLYKLILGKPGHILEFGVQWGSSLNMLINLRGTYEPYNHSRHIFGFDTFAGLLGVDESLEGGFAKDGDYLILDNYEDKLNSILELQESFSPIAHLKKFELIRGDAAKTIHDWTKVHAGSTIAMAIFDMDIYKPTKEVLMSIKPFLYRGSVLVFDEFSAEHWPGERMALDEVFGLGTLVMNHFPSQPYCSWTVIGE